MGGQRTIYLLSNCPTQRKHLRDLSDDIRAPLTGDFCFQEKPLTLGFDFVSDASLVKVFLEKGFPALLSSVGVPTIFRTEIMLMIR